MGNKRKHSEIQTAKPTMYVLLISVHTMEELKLTGNHLKGFASFVDSLGNFEKDAHWKLLKEMIIQVGPRFCLNPIKIFAGSFGGRTLYVNPFYVSRNQIRALEKKRKAEKYAKKVKAKMRRKMHELSNPLVEPDEFADMWRIDLFFCK